MRFYRWDTVDGDPDTGFYWTPATVLSPETVAGLSPGPIYLRFRVRTNAYIGGGAGHSGGMKWFIFGGPGISGERRMIMWFRAASYAPAPDYTPLGTDSVSTCIEMSAGVSGNRCQALYTNSEWVHVQIAWAYTGATGGPYMRIYINNNTVGSPNGEHTAFTSDGLGGAWSYPEGWDTGHWADIVTTGSVSTTNAELDFLDMQFGTTFDDTWYPNGITVSATTDSLVLTEYPATIAGATTIQAGTDSLVLTEYQANVALDINVTASAVALTLTEYPATVDVGGIAVNVQATTQALLLTEYPATIIYPIDVLVSTQELVLTTYPSTIETTSVVRAVPSAFGWDAYLDRLERKRRRRKKELEEQRIALEQAKAELDQEKANAEQLPKLPNAIIRRIKAQEREIEAMLDRLESLMVLDYLEYEQEQKQEQIRKKRNRTALVLLLAA